MTRQEWKECQKPFDMMRYLLSKNAYECVLAKEIKFGLYARACCWEMSTDCGMSGDYCFKEKAGPGKNFYNWAMGWSGDQELPSEPFRADLIREIFSDNPAVPSLKCRVPCENCADPDKIPCVVCHDTKYLNRVPWLTSEIVSLAQACYQWPIKGVTLDPSRVSILADSLEDVGKPAENFVEHFRAKTWHCKGCNVIDTLLGY